MVTVLLLLFTCTECTRVKLIPCALTCRVWVWYPGAWETNFQTHFSHFYAKEFNCPLCVLRINIWVKNKVKSVVYIFTLCGRAQYMITQIHVQIPTAMVIQTEKISPLTIVRSHEIFFFWFSIIQLKLTPDNSLVFLIPIFFENLPRCLIYFYGHFSYLGFTYRFFISNCFL